MNQQIFKKLFSLSLFILFTYFSFYIVNAADYSNVQATPITEVVDVAKRAFNVAIAASGVVFAMYIIYAAVKLSLSYGDPEGFNQAKYSLTWSLIGYLVILSFFVIVRLVLNLFGSSAAPTANDPFSKFFEGLSSFYKYIYK